MKNGKIIRLLDDHTVIIDLGLGDGVETRMRFGIFSASQEIVHPDTLETLGSYRKRKGVVVVNEVFDRFCVASTPVVREETTEERQPWSIGPTKIRRERTYQPSLDAVEEQIEGILGGGSVAVGDFVELLR